MTKDELQELVDEPFEKARHTHKKWVMVNRRLDSLLKRVKSVLLLVSSLLSRRLNKEVAAAQMVALSRLEKLFELAANGELGVPILRWMRTPGDGGFLLCRVVKIGSRRPRLVLNDETNDLLNRSMVDSGAFFNEGGEYRRGNPPTGFPSSRPSWVSAIEIPLGEVSQDEFVDLVSKLIEENRWGFDYLQKKVVVPEGNHFEWRGPGRLELPGDNRRWVFYLSLDRYAILSPRCDEYYSCSPSLEGRNPFTEEDREILISRSESPSFWGE